MSATIIDIRDARDLLDPLPAIVTTERTVQWGSDVYTVSYSVNTRGLGGWFKVVDQESGATIICRCGKDDPYAVDTAIIAYRAGIARGRAQMQDALECRA